ncbi:hypothetical protein G4B88_028665 [Cannabis sativa]|uniref:Uncharacterized protein n=1 Tax=Cannabis sativa TaxID=3483 RepID=A0A7J6EAP9_CANSA|nr:hypothetical protein G4B88_028665 [Cannabis sativa]
MRLSSSEPCLIVIAIPELLLELVNDILVNLKSLSKDMRNNDREKCYDKNVYIQALWGSSTATQKSWRGLGSEAEAMKAAKANTTEINVTLISLFCRTLGVNSWKSSTIPGHCSHTILATQTQKKIVPATGDTLQDQRLSSKGQRRPAQSSSLSARDRCSSILGAVCSSISDYVKIMWVIIYIIYIILK